MAGRPWMTFPIAVLLIAPAFWRERTTMAAFRTITGFANRITIPIMKAPSTETTRGKIYKNPKLIILKFKKKLNFKIWIEKIITHPLLQTLGGLRWRQGRDTSWCSKSRIIFLPFSVFSIIFYGRLWNNIKNVES